MKCITVLNIRINMRFTNTENQFQICKIRKYVKSALKALQMLYKFTLKMKTEKYSKVYQYFLCVKLPDLKAHVEYKAVCTVSVHVILIEGIVELVGELLMLSSVHFIHHLRDASHGTLVKHFLLQSGTRRVGTLLQVRQVGVFLPFALALRPLLALAEGLRGAQVLPCGRLNLPHQLWVSPVRLFFLEFHLLFFQTLRILFVGWSS